MIDIRLPPNYSFRMSRLQARTHTYFLNGKRKSNSESLLLANECEIQRDLGRCTLSLLDAWTSIGVCTSPTLMSNPLPPLVIFWRPDIKKSIIWMYRIRLFSLIVCRKWRISSRQQLMKNEKKWDFWNAMASKSISTLWL